MRNTICIAAGIMFFALSCNDRGTDSGQFSNTLQEDQWRISYSTYDGKDQTFAFDGYKITFTVQNTMTAIGVNFYRGEWTAGVDRDRLTLTMDWGGMFPFTVLNYKWYVISYDNQSVALEYYNAYYGGLDYLIFEKM